MIKSNINRTLVLMKLLKQSPSLVSSSDLISCTEISRQAIWKAVESLKNEGFIIEAIPQKGYRLVSLPDNDLSVSYITALTCSICPWYKNIILFESIDSTQIEAKRLARSGSGSGTTVISRVQTAGRGRMDRKWMSPPEGLYFSVVTRPVIPPGQIQILNLAAGIAARKAISSSAGIECDLKWPNDILSGNAKLCGIISEASMEIDSVHYIVTGIGINVNNSEKLNQNTTDFKAATIEQLSGKKINRSFLLSLFLQYFYEILKLFENEGSQEIIKEYRKHCSTLGRNVSVITRKGIFKGKVENINQKGELAVLTERGETTFFSAGDVIHAPLSESL